MIAPLLLATCAAFPSVTEILPSFDAKLCAYHATDVVVVTEGDVIDGRVTVLETWVGALEPETILELPDLRAFASEDSRRTGGFAGLSSRENVLVGADRMILFLERHEGAWRGAWPTDWERRLHVSTVWVHAGAVFALRQWINPGPLVMQRERGLTERALRDDVLAVVGAHDALEAARDVADPAQRTRIAMALLPTLPWRAQRETVDELAHLGAPAHAAVRSYLERPTHRESFGLLVPLLMQLDADATVPFLIGELQREIAFFYARADTLRPGWWNDAQLAPKERTHHRERYGRMVTVLRALALGRDERVRAPVETLRALWTSHSAYDDPSGLHQVVEECDRILARLD